MTSQEARFVADLFVNMLVYESEITRRVLAAVPENQLEFKLGEKGRTARELMWHTAFSEEWFARGIAAGEFPMEPEPAAPATTAEIVAWYDANVPPAIAKMKTLDGEHLARAIPFFGMPPMATVMYLNFWKIHSIHHRGQLSTYLRAMNARVPDIYGGSADEPYQAPATA